MPIVFCNPVANLKDCPPFKIEGRAGLEGGGRDVGVLRNFETGPARELAESRRPGASADCSKRWPSTTATPRHFLLGHCYLYEGRPTEAKQEFIRAKDEDICPLRMLEPMYQALADVSQTNRVPLVDVRTSDRSPNTRWHSRSRVAHGPRASDH